MIEELLVFEIQERQRLIDEAIERTDQTASVDASKVKRLEEVDGIRYKANFDYCNVELFKSEEGNNFNIVQITTKFLDPSYRFTNPVDSGFFGVREWYQGNKQGLSMVALSVIEDLNQNPCLRTVRTEGDIGERARKRFDNLLLYISNAEYKLF